MKVAIVGSRTYPDLGRVRRYVFALPPGTVVVSGGATGVDQTAERAARDCGLPVVVFLPDYRSLGQRATFARNTQIVETSDRVTAFWDGRSRGTLHTITEAVRLDRPLLINPS